MQSFRSALGVPLIMASVLTVGCGGGRDAHDIAVDLEGTVSPSMIDHLVRNVDLSRTALDVSVGRGVNEHFGGGDQQAFESFLQNAAGEMTGDRVRVTQEVLNDTGPETQRLTVTLALESEGKTRYVPVTMDLLRNGRHVAVTRFRAMTGER